MPLAPRPQPSRPDHVEAEWQAAPDGCGQRSVRRGGHRADRGRRLILSGALALGLVGVAGGVAEAAGLPVLDPSRTDVRTSMVHGSLTVTRVHCHWWFWCSPVPASVSGRPVALRTDTAIGGPTEQLPAPSRSVPPSALPGATRSVTVPPTVPPTVPVPLASSTGTTTSARKPASRATRSGRPVTSAPAGTPSAPTAGDALARQILAQLNAARAAAGVASLAMTDGLVRSATKHTTLMAGSCGMSHQCPGEADLGARISAEGVRWSSVGENVGYGGPMPRTDAGIVSMGKQITESMLAETPPNDGHRRNILNAGFTHIGISLYQDPKGTVWMTQDFSN